MEKNQRVTSTKVNLRFNWATYSSFLRVNSCSSSNLSVKLKTMTLSVIGRAQSIMTLHRHHRDVTT